MRRSHHPSTHTVRTCPVLVHTNLGMASSYPSAAATTPTHLHPVLSHLRSGHRGDVGHVGNIHPLLLEHPSTSGTVVVVHRHIHGRPPQLRRRGWLPVAEVPHARLSTRTSGLVGPSTLGERRRLTLAGPLGGGELPAQLPDRQGQTRVVTLQSVYLGDQVPVFTGWRVSVRAHSRSIRTCPSHRNASAEAANQLLGDLWRMIAWEGWRNCGGVCDMGTPSVEIAIGD